MEVSNSSSRKLKWFSESAIEILKLSCFDWMECGGNYEPEIGGITWYYCSFFPDIYLGIYSYVIHQSDYIKTKDDYVIRHPNSKEEDFDLMLTLQNSDEILFHLNQILEHMEQYG